MTEEKKIIWIAPVVEKPEFRLYYDDNGKVICYTGDKTLPGNFIVIDALTFAAARPDVRVVDGKIAQAAASFTVSKLMPNDSEGVDCHNEDISIIVDTTYSGNKIKWKLNTYDLG